MRIEYGIEVDKDTFDKIRSLDEERRRILDDDLKEVLKKQSKSLS